MYSSTRRARLTAGICALTLVAAGCGDDDSEAAAAEPATIEVNAVDFEYENLPDTVAAGTTLTLVNDAPTELHELVAFRLPDDEERSVDELVALPPDELLPNSRSAADQKRL